MLIGLLPNWILLAVLITLFLIMLMIPGMDNSMSSIFTYLFLVICSILLTMGHVLEENILIGILEIAVIVCKKNVAGSDEEDRARIKQTIRIHS